MTTKEDGLDLRKLAVGTKLDIKTKNHLYIAEKIDGDKFAVTSDNPDYFALTQDTFILGSTDGSSAIKLAHIVIGMRMQFPHPNYMERFDKFLTTSEVESIKIKGPNRDWEYVLA